MQAVARIADLRNRLAEDDLIKADVAEATKKLVALGLPEQRAQQEAERVPPLPAARFVRPAVFPKSRTADEKRWCATAAAVLSKTPQNITLDVRCYGSTCLNFDQVGTVAGIFTGAPSSC